MSKILEGVRVLDFGRYVAGPFCAAQLADLGADVIRIERLSGGEDRYLFPVSSEGDGSLYLQMNRNKRAMTLDPRTPSGLAVMDRLIATADVVIINTPPSSLPALGLEYDRLTGIKSDIILTVVSAFGPEGPYAERVGFDGVGQAMSGAVGLSGHPGAPMKSFAQWVDFTTALFATQHTLAALMDRARTGRGREIHADLLSSALAVMNGPLIEQATTGANRVASGNRAQSGAPADLFATRDGWIMIQVVGEPLFRRWARLMGESSWLEDPRFSTDALRAEHGEALSARTAAWTSSRSTAEAMAALTQAKLPAGPVLSPQQVLDDSHVVAAAPFAAMDYPGLATPAPVLLSPARFAGETPTLHRRAPLLNEHTDEILSSLGYDESEISAFRLEGAIR